MSANDHRYFDSTVFPYAPFGSPTESAPEFSDGRNILTSIKGYCERRPGITALESGSPVTFVSLRRLFVWRRWNSDFIVMANDVTASTSIVYKMNLSSDTAFSAIHTDSSSTSPFDFVVANNFVFFGNGVAGNMKKYDGTTVTNWGITAPASAPTVAASGAGTLDATVGYFYVYAYGSSATDHISSPSPVSTNTSTFTNDDRAVTVAASADAQVDRVHIYRSTDGGSGVYFEITNSPFTNTAGPHADATADASLSSSAAPTSGFNDPPPASYGFIYYANRIWMIEANTNKVWFTGWEEISNGVAEECVPSGVAGNFYAYDAEVVGLAPVEDGVLKFTAAKIFKVRGDSLDTFFRRKFAEGVGCRQRAAITSMGKMVAWLDSSSTVWATDGYQLQEIGKDIRSDISSISHATSCMTFFAGKTFRWLLLSDGELVWPMDVDREVWMPPWSCVARCLGSGETSSGVFDLLIGLNATRVGKFNFSSTYTDLGTAYSAYVVTNLFEILPKPQPDRLGSVEHVGLETSANEPTSVGLLVDDDPAQASHTTIASTDVRDAELRAQGTYIKDRWYHIRKPAGRRASIRVDWPETNTSFQWYTLDLAYKQVGGR